MKARLAMTCRLLLVITSANPPSGAPMNQRRYQLEPHVNNRIEADHGSLKHGLRSMLGPRTDSSAQIIIAGLAIM
jgi:transposase-like protein